MRRPLFPMPISKPPVTGAMVGMVFSQTERTMGTTPHKGLNHDTLGKTYDFDPVVVDQQTIDAYCDATNDANPRYLDAARPDGTVAPPLYIIRIGRDPLFSAILDPKVNADVVRLLHGEQDFSFHHLVRPGDPIRTRGVIADIIDKETGQILVVHIDFFRDDQLVADCDATLFIRAKHPPKREKKAKPEPPPEPTWTFTEDILVADDQSVRYAEVSQDVNPLHTNPMVAKAAGLPGVVLHGLCTMAFCHHALINRLAHGDPARLRRIKVRFSKPVFMKDVVTVKGVTVEPDGDGGHNAEFVAVNQEGVEVITAGTAWIAPAGDNG